MLNLEETDLLKKMTDLVIDDDREDILVSKTFQNLLATPYPTAKNKMVRFLDAEPLEEGSIEENCFIRNELGFLIIFVDPCELSYHNIENIISLDSLFQMQTKFKIEDYKRHEKYAIAKFDLTDHENILLSLDKFGLYTRPLNNIARGGERFIFSSEKLSEYLTNAIKNLNDKDLSDPAFMFVNYVFRYNKFRKGEKSFLSHFDTPFYDPIKKLYSKYTLILYLTEGKSDPNPVISFQNQKVRILEIKTGGKIRGIIFDQKYEHEGNSFIDNDKIFIRSELIYNFSADSLNYCELISKQFNIACYLTKQSLFKPELQKMASDYFNQIAEARLNLSKNKITTDILIFKSLKDLCFITNGFDYWFHKEIAIKDCAFITLLDSMNCKIKDFSGSFNTLTYDIVLDPEINSISEIYQYLEKHTKNKILLKKEFPNPKWQKKVLQPISYKTLEDQCCYTHYRNDDFYLKSRQVRMIYDKKVKENEARWEKIKNNYHLIIYDKEVYINSSKMEIIDNYILFAGNIPPVNFAACQSGELPEDFIISKTNKIKGYGNIPPIWFESTEKGHHLKIELFNSKFLRKLDTEMRDYEISKENYGKINSKDDEFESDYYRGVINSVL